MNKLRTISTAIGIMLILTAVMPALLSIGHAVAEAQQVGNQVYYYEGFETGDGEYTTSESSWSWGAPDYVNQDSGVTITAAHNGQYVWGSNLSGDYPINSTHVLTSAVINVSNIPPGETILLEWWQNWDLGAGDAGYAEVILDNNNWLLVDFFDGQSDGWQKRAIYVSSATETVQLRWKLISDGDDSTGAGIYLDDIAIRNPGAAITLETTVGRDPDKCADSQTVTIPYPGDKVYYCHSLTNIGDPVELISHTLVDSELGAIFVNAGFTLTSTLQITTEVAINKSMESTNTWTATNATRTEITSASSQTAVHTFVSGNLPVARVLPEETVTTTLTLANSATESLSWQTSQSTEMCGSTPPAWLTLSDTSGNIPAGESQEVILTFNAAGLETGVHNNSLCLLRDDPQLPVAEIPVSLSIETPTYLRLAHLAPLSNSGSTVDVTVNGDMVLTGASYGDSTPYLPLLAGSYDIALSPVFSDGRTPSASITVDTVSGQHQTIIATGGANGHSLKWLAIADTLPEPTAGNGYMRFAHVAPFDSDPATTTATFETELSSQIWATLQLGEVSGNYMTQPSGVYDLILRSQSSGAVIFDLPKYQLNNGERVDFIAVGDGQNEPVGVFVYPADSKGYLLSENSAVYLPFFVSQR